LPDQLLDHLVGDAAEIRRHAADLAALAPDVILAVGTAAMGPLLQATRTVPIVFVTVAREYESSPSELDCHVTLPWGSYPCNGRTLPRFDRAVGDYFKAVSAFSPLLIREQP
jgi:hypothetical protein